MNLKKEYKLYLKIVLLILFSTIIYSFGDDTFITISRHINTLGSTGPNGPDTLNVKIKFFAEGNYDTTWQIDTTFDTTRTPLDILLAIDLSLSMSWIDSLGNTNQWPRLVWAKLAALNFLDSLTENDRVSVLGWTAVGTPSSLADTANSNRYYQKWLPFTSNFDSVRTFIFDSLFIDSTSRYLDTINGNQIVIRDKIPNGNFTSTPLRISSILSMSRLATYGRSNSIKALIMLTDGSNNDGLEKQNVITTIDSLYRNKKVQYFGIGFMSGDTTELGSLSQAGGGNYYNANSSDELDSAYAKLAHQLINITIDTNFITDPILISPDTLYVPNDIVLAIDLSGSMIEKDNSNHRRIAWVKIAALGFLDSLKKDDRVAILGWTGNKGIALYDTSNNLKYYKKWQYLTSNFEDAKSFICNDIFCGGSFMTDTLNGIPLILRSSIPNSFSYTPLRISSIVASSYLSQFSRKNATKSIIMLTDGLNNDKESINTVEFFLDSLKRSQRQQFHTIGFKEGNTNELQTYAVAGGGVFINAQNSDELQNAYASLANMLVNEKIVARKLMIQEVLQNPSVTYIEGSQKTTNMSTSQAENFTAFKDAQNNTVLRWNFKNIKIWSNAEISYNAIAANGAHTLIGLDSLHSTTGFWSQIVYMNDESKSFTINLKPSNVDTTVNKKNNLLKNHNGVSFLQRNKNIYLKTDQNTTLNLQLYSLNGKSLCTFKKNNVLKNQITLFRIPSSLSKGVYILYIKTIKSTIKNKISIY